MPGVSTTADDSSRGGLGVVLFVFFLLSFTLTLGAQILLARLWDGNLVRQASEEIVVEKDLVQPRPDFPPEKVVALQLEGLANASSSAGIQQCFVFASPSNKQMTGPLARFAAMLRRPPYNVLLNHELMLIGKPIVSDDSANIVVTLLDDHDEIHVFQFLLSKQHGKDVENCWMTDAVFPLQQIPAKAPHDVPTAGLSARYFPRRFGMQDPAGWIAFAPQRVQHG